MSELENQIDEQNSQDEYVEEVEQDEAVEPDESEAAELAPDSEAEHEEKQQDEHRINQDKVNQVINRKHKEAMEWKEKYEALAQQQQPVQESAPPIPDEPDIFADDYEEKKRAYIEAIRKRERWEAEQEVKKLYAEQLQQQQSQKQMQELQKQSEVYVKKASEFGIKPEELQEYGQAAAQYVNQDLAMAIVADDEGALITKYLALNPLEAESLSQMNPYAAAMHLERSIRPKAQQLKPKPSNAPKPPTKVDGKANVDNSGLKHARGSFE